MKFTEKLNAHLTPEWRQQYIAYSDLKHMILNAVEISNDRTKTSHFTNFEEDFFFECDKELRKINNFYAEKLSEATRRNEFISTVLDVMIDEFRSCSITRKALLQNVFKKKFKRQKVKIADLKNAFSELYLSLVLLKNYKMLNYTGFRKILKKFDKLLHNSNGSKWFEENISTAYFFIDRDLDRLMQEVEDHFTQYLENGDRTQAMKRLRVPPLKEIPQMGTLFRAGLFLGAFLVLLCFTFALTFFGNAPFNSQAVNVHKLILFRAPFYVIIYLFLLAINVFYWRRAGVNHILIFELNPRQHLSYTHLLEIHGIFGLLWGLCVVVFIYAENIHIPKLLLPLLLMGIMLLILFNPLPMFYRNARYWLLKVMARVIMAPLFNVGFADFWFGDQLNSMVACLLDIKYLLCFYVSNNDLKDNFQANQCLEKDYIGNAIVRCIPSWLRFAQCLRRYSDTGQAFPFLVNAGKYATTFPLVLFLTLTAKYNDNYEFALQNPFFWYYVASATFSSCYCCCYDILRDFGLFETFSKKNMFLREHIIYPPVFYYFAILENVILRFFWAISLCLVTNNYIDSHNMDSLAGCLEIIRRFIWNYLRLENEHLFNVGQFRAVRDIFIEPLNIKNSIDQDDEDKEEHDSATNFNESVVIKGLNKNINVHDDDDDDDE